MIEQLLQDAVRCHKKHDLARAELLYKEILTKEPNHVDATHYLALIAQEVGRHDIAVLLLEKTASICPEDANIRYNLGLSLQHMDKLEEAKLQYFQAIKLNQNSAPPYNNLGVIYQQEGDHQKANTLFEKAITIDPGFADAYYNLSIGDSYKKKPNFLNKIEKLLEQNDLAKNAEIVCHFALGKIYDDLGLYDQAFMHYKNGNDLKETGFNIPAYEKYINSITQTFKPEIIKKGEAIKKSANDIIFIVGMPRSGTTLIEQIISSHHSVTAGGELGLIGDYIDDLDNIVTINEPYPHCASTLDQMQLDSLSSRLLIDLERKYPGHSIITDKTPINFLHIGFITLLFPQSKIIYCQRDPLDVCLSCYFQNFNRQHHYSNNLKTLGQFYNLQSRLMNHWQAIIPERILTVQYEQLVSNGEEEIRRIIDFCQLEWDDECLKFDRKSGKVKTASNWQVRQPLYNSSVRRWKNYEIHIQELIDAINQ